MVVVIVTIMIDSEIGIVSDFISDRLSSNMGIVAFIGIATIFTVTQHFILAYIKQSNKESKARALYLNVMHFIVYVAQYILAFIILQILTIQHYSLVTLYVSYAISYGL